jgi:hypothetical protein
MLPLGLFLAPDTQRGPRHSHESFCLDVFATTDTLAVLASVNCLQGIFNRSQAEKNLYQASDSTGCTKTLTWV